MSETMLVVANRSCPCVALLDEVAERARETQADVLIVAPALNGRLAHHLSDTDGALRAARTRLDTAVAYLREAGLDARGEVGDARPLLAVQDALHDNHVSEIVISTFPEGRSHWLEKGLVEEARARFGLPVTHVMSAYDLEPAVA